MNAQITLLYLVYPNNIIIKFQLEMEFLLFFTLWNSYTRSFSYSFFVRCKDDSAIDFEIFQRVQICAKMNSTAHNGCKFWLHNVLHCVWLRPIQCITQHAHCTHCTLIEVEVSIVLKSKYGDTFISLHIAQSHMRRTIERRKKNILKKVDFFHKLRKLDKLDVCQLLTEQQNSIILKSLSQSGKCNLQSSVQRRTNSFGIWILEQYNAVEC